MVFVFLCHLWPVLNHIPELPYQNLKTGPRYVHFEKTWQYWLECEKEKCSDIIDENKNEFSYYGEQSREQSYEVKNVSLESSFPDIV